MYIKNGPHGSYSPIGIDIGSRSINAVQLANLSGGVCIHEADIMMLTDTDVKDDMLVEALGKIMGRNNFKGKEVVSRMPPSMVSIIPIKILPRENETLEQAILRESREYLPCPIEEAVIDFIPIGNTEEGADKPKKLLLIFAKRSDVINYLSIFKKAGFKVNAIDIGPNAINRTITRFKDPSVRRLLVINIGDIDSFSTILWDDMILIDRKMGWGETNVIEKVVSNLDIDRDEARKVLYRYGIDWSSSPSNYVDESTRIMSDDAIPAHIYEIIAPALEDLNKEIEKVLIYCTSEMKGAIIDQVYLIGGGGLLKHLSSYLQKTFGINVNSFEPERIFSQMQPLKGVVKDNLSIFVISIGLALRDYNA